MRELVVKESVNILRNQREEFETSFSQRGRKQHINSISRETEEAPKLLWKKKISKEGPLQLSKLGVKENSIGILCQEYTKIINTNSG